MMSVSRVSRLSLGLITGLGLLACRQNPLLKELNPSPHALAKATVSGSTITLDGTGSKDDGTIVSYRWLSDTRRPDQKTGRYAPPDLSPAQAAGWPGDGPIVTVPNVPE